MTTTADAILQAFSDAGLRATVPRRRIAEWLATASSTGRDFVAEDLRRELVAGPDSPGRATVFRTLDALERTGVVDRIEGSDGSRRYRVCASGGHHHHVVCTVCGRVSEVRTCLPPPMLAAIEAETDFSLERHSLELFGRCPRCR